MLGNAMMIWPILVTITLGVLQKGNRRGGIVLLNDCPPESSDNHCNVLYKSLRKQYSGYVIDRDG
jgi:hypothetical protein